MMSRLAWLIRQYYRWLSNITNAFKHGVNLMENSMD